VYLHPQTLAQLGSMELRAKMIVEGVMSGTHRSPYRGVSVEFAEHRPYTPGDDLRHLDWKVWARTDKLQLKQYQQETNLDLIVMVDASGSMGFGTRSFESASGTGQKAGPDGRAEWTKFDHATALAAALSYVTLRQGDRVGLVVFAGQVLASVPRAGARGQWKRIVSALSTHPVQDPTDLGRSVEQVVATVGSRAVIALVSDLFVDPERYREALARIRHRGHDLIAFQVVDQRELDLEMGGAAPFVGLEGEGMIRVDPRALREAYTSAIREHTESLEHTTRGLGFDFHTVVTHDWLGPSLASYVARRSAQLKRSAQR